MHAAMPSACSPAPPRHATPAARAAAVVLCAFALGLASCGGGADLVVEPASVAYGPVRQGEVRITRVRLHNQGAKDVTFQAAVTCACFALEGGYRNVLAPDEVLDLTLRFDSRQQPPGRLEKFLEIRTNEDGARLVSVPLRADIVRVLDLSGATIQLGPIDGDPQDFVPRTVEFRPTQGYTVTLEKIEPLGADSAHLTFTPQPATPAGVILVEVALQRDGRRAIGPFHAGARVHLKMTAPDGQAFTLAETVQVEGFWASDTRR
jgi:hypothetical protein